MNLEEPTQPMRPQQINPSNNPVPQGAPNADTPMDEFEYTGKSSKMSAKNILKLAKIGGILLGVIVIVGVVAIIGSQLLKPRQPGEVAQSAAPSQSAVPATEKPQIIYPTEYDTVQRDVTAYDKAVNSVPDDRTRIDVPQFKFGISFN